MGTSRVVAPLREAGGGGWIVVGSGSPRNIANAHAPAVWVALCAGLGGGGVADADAATGLVESRVKLVDSQPSISILHDAELSTAAAGAESVRVFNAKRAGFSSLGTFPLPSSAHAPEQRARTFAPLKSSLEKVSKSNSPPAARADCRRAQPWLSWSNTWWAAS